MHKSKLIRLVFERDIERATYQYAANSGLEERTALYQHIFCDERTKAMHDLDAWDFGERYHTFRAQDGSRYYLRAEYWVGDE